MDFDTFFATLDSVDPDAPNYRTTTFSQVSANPGLMQALFTGFVGGNNVLTAATYEALLDAMVAASAVGSSVKLDMMAFCPS